MEHSILPIESIQERDVDLILLEELSSDDLFCDWLVNKLGLPNLSLIEGAWRSINAFGLGETDILFSYFSGSLKIYVLIENKLNTSFQDQQYDRYVKRATSYVEQKECHKAFVVLLAPKNYCENQDDFKTYLTYEDISEKLLSAGSKRSLFKSKLLNIAVEKLRRGYQPINSPAVQNFWDLYWIYKEDNFKVFSMSKPTVVPHKSDWPMLKDANLNNIVFYHKLSQGNIDVTFFGYSDEVEIKIMKSIPDWTEYKKHSKTFSIRASTDKIDRTCSFDDQIEKVHNGLIKMELIRSWILKNKSLLS
jgi:hypothetical protein|tara:strand:- start:101 stop:1015 length:915 start_codon:yes stop_codon:yes gene_type:complete